MTDSPRVSALRRETERGWPVVVAIVIGILGALANLIFREVVAGSTWLFQSVLEAPLGRPGILVGLLAGGVALLILDRLFPGEVLGYGFPRFLESLHTRGARVKRRWMIVKTLGAAISLGAGASVGREGPIAQVGGAVGSAVARLARVSIERRKVLIACGAAAAVATTFNAPLGALMFAHEIVLLGEVHLPNFVLVVISTTTAVVASRGIFGSPPVFNVPAFVMESYWECLSYGLLGVTLGVLGAAYTRIFHFTATYLRSFGLSRGVLLLAGLGAVGVIGMVAPHSISDGYEVINEALAGRLTWQLMAALVVAKIVASSLSLGCGAPGGVFGPILFIGAMAGGSFRALSEAWMPELTGPRGSYALVGLGAFLAATTHAPLTAIFLLFELTQSHEVAVPALIATIVGLMVSTRLEPESIDTLGLTAEGKSLHPPSDRELLERIPVETVYRRDVDAIPESCVLPDLLQRVRKSGSSTYPVIATDGSLAGVLSFSTLRALLLQEDVDGSRTAGDICDRSAVTLAPSDGLGAAFRRMEAEGLEAVPVVDAVSRRLLGTLSRADLIAAYNRTVATLGATPLPAWLHAGPTEELGEYHVMAVEVPPPWVGKRLDTLDARGLGVAVLAVRARGIGDSGARYETPDPEHELSAGDVLILAGTLEALRRARKVA
jgi:CIC family chloride channel protein